MKYSSTLWFAAIVLLASPLCAKQQGQYLEITADEYYDKVYASWLGQCVANIYGLPHENRYIEQPGPDTFPYGYREKKRLSQYNGAFTDDDTDIEYMYLLSMEKYGIEPAYEQLAHDWMYHIRQRVWLANRAALAAMHHGYTPPFTGNPKINPHWFQIDPQLINEIWAVTAPGMVDYAAQKSAWAARIMDDGWGIEPTIHYGAMYAAAFFVSDIGKLIDIGVDALPKNSRFAATVAHVKALYTQYPDDWKKARQELVDRYYHQEPLETRTIWNANLNGALGILALLYGKGDFQRTLDFACAIGMDADNQAASMCGLLGVIHGASIIPHDLLYPFPERNWQEPLNDSYKNISRYDLPDASLKDMAQRTVAQAEKIIVGYGGKKITANGKSRYLINSSARFTAPLELPAGPMPVIEVGKPFSHEFTATGGQPPCNWSVLGASIPSGVGLRNNVISGVPRKAGIFPLTLQVKDGDREASRSFPIVIRGENLAPQASEVIAAVKHTDTAWRDAMWLSVPHSLYADNLEDIIRDGKYYGNGSTFYSIRGNSEPQIDYYGYIWDKPQNIGLIGFHTGSMEENGGWFDNLQVEYRNDQGTWQNVENLVMSPHLPGPLPEVDWEDRDDFQDAYNKPHFVEYLLAFEPVRTTAIRIIGDAGAAKHWRSKRTHFTSITELSVHGPLPGYEKLAE